MTAIKRLILTPGEPAGIGPDITIQIAQQDWPFEIIVIADQQLLTERAAQLQLPLQLIGAHLDKTPRSHVAGTLNIIHEPLAAPVNAGTLNPANAKYVLNTLELAARICTDKRADALVTGPVHKKILNDAGIPFTGHTEFLAQYCHVEHTVMLFVIDQLKVALATTHVPLADVSKVLTADQLIKTLKIFTTGLQQYFDIQQPRLLVCGLNPHAGEGGLLGREEIEVISPALDVLRAQDYQLIGPLPADTIFTKNILESADAVLAMYHDQALPLIKYLGFERAVNVTLGLPFLRTSVDHGTALALAGTGSAHPGSLSCALELAASISH
jgi:4-hydroxythreonine-4-phosphate dehydrogenase